MKAIIFDCYGVLVGTGFWNVYRRLGGDPAKDAVFIENWLNKTNLAGPTPVEMNQIMADHLGVSLQEYQEAFRKDELPDEELFEFIRTELKPKYKLALVSNATGDSVRRKIPADRLALFNEVLISGEVKMLKPDPELFQLALDRLGVIAEETVFVDDHEPYIEGAKSVGLQTILYTDFKSFKQSLKELK